MNKLPVLKLIKAHEPVEIGLSALFGLAFFLLYGGITITPMIMISMLFVPYIQYFLLGMYVVSSLVASYGFQRMAESLKNYRTALDVDYNTITTRFTVGFAIIVFIVLSFVYINYLQ